MKIFNTIVFIIILLPRTLILSMSGCSEDQEEQKKLIKLLAHATNNHIVSIINSDDNYNPLIKILTELENREKQQNASTTQVDDINQLISELKINIKNIRSNP